MPSSTCLRERGGEVAPEGPQQRLLVVLQVLQQHRVQQPQQPQPLLVRRLLLRAVVPSSRLLHLR